jgi:hypothetical protein
MLAGLLVVVFVGGAVILSGGMALYGLAFHGSEIAKLGLLWFVASILFGLGEEYICTKVALARYRVAAGGIDRVSDPSLGPSGEAGRECDGYRYALFLALTVCLSVRQTGSFWWAVGRCCLERVIVERLQVCHSVRLRFFIYEQII